ncbi:MAG: C40 family peptidase [Lachnospiraceae bacterium]|nr:C40 family peptidase [Lachnospiraceae bacterium]
MALQNRFRLMMAAVALCVAAVPMHAFAASDGLLLSSAGIGSIFTMEYSAEELVAFADAAQGAHWGYTNLGIANTDGSNLNVRETPSTSGKLVGKMRNHAACEVIAIEDGWAQIKSGEVEGYCSMDYLLVGADAVNIAKELVETVAIAKENGINVRQEPNTDSQVMTQIAKGEELEFVEDLEDWIHVTVDDEDAYVFAEYVTVETKLDTAITMSELLYGEGVSDVRVDLVEYAKGFLGNPYKYGGTSLTKGTDCSGFTQGVFKKFGIKLERSSVAQSKNGKTITTADLLPGDLIFYSKNGSINHVALYIGGGQVIHASNEKYGIRISKYNYRTPTKCVRMIND